MPEAEEVLSDAARHATAYAQALWRRSRKGKAPTYLLLDDVKARLELLCAALTGGSAPLRIAEPPPRATALSRLFRRGPDLRRKDAVPATDGNSLWLPRSADVVEPEVALDRYRTLALVQATRATRGSAALVARASSPAAAALYLLFEAHSADQALVRELPGARAGLDALKTDARRRRPTLSRVPEPLRPLERALQLLEDTPSGEAPAGLAIPPEPEAALAYAEELASTWIPLARWRAVEGPLLLDRWTGELRPHAAPARVKALEGEGASEDPRAAPRRARLPRTPRVREAEDDEDDSPPGAWMVQTAEPHEIVEDPFGIQRPSDRDDDGGADDLADALSDLPEARLVSTPNPAKEVLLSDDAPEVERAAASPPEARGERTLRYPEWDHRAGGYRRPGATVHLVDAPLGSAPWVERTLAKHAALLQEVRRQFELLRPERERLRRQLEGDDVDLHAFVDARADLRAGRPLGQALYESRRRARRSLAVTLLIDVSGSTDAFLTDGRRVIDVEKEALLVVCLALERLGEPYAVLAFSGEGPHGVVVSTLKPSDAPFGADVARRIAALEPERNTRTGAALRHATQVLLRERAEHRLLLLLSDGKPNDLDEYEGRYGVEDTRQAVNEARLQGIFPFCLTVDRTAPSYLPRVFGPHQYSLLQRPEDLPAALVGWLRRLLQQ